MKKQWLFPEYYSAFSCKADQCRNTCCSSWRIPVSKKEYNALITMECSEELNRRVQGAFVMPDFVSDDIYRYVSFNWLGNCPIQDKGLCALHREKGEGYLPKICRLYPRSLKQINDTLFASCSGSCEKVTEILYENKSLNILEGELDAKPELFYTVEDDDITQILAIQDVMKEENMDLPAKIAKVCRMINAEEFVKDYDCNREVLSDAIALLKRLSGDNVILNEVCEESEKRYGRNPDLYYKDAKEFEERFSDHRGFFGRMINNSMMYECFPFVDKRTDKTAAYRGLCICYGLLRLVCIVYCLEHRKKEDLIDAVCALFRLIDHTAFYYNVSVLTENAAAFLKM